MQGGYVMAGVATFALDDAEFQGVMGDYLRVSSKDGAAAMNRTMNNLAIFGHDEARVAQLAEIENVQALDWWPAYVATRMVKRKAKQLAVRMEKASRKGKTISSKTYRRLVAFHYTRDEARKESARIGRRRSVSVGFLRFFFVSLSRQMRTAVPGMRVPPSKSFKGFDVTISAATEDRPMVTAEVRYPYRSRGEASVKKAEALLQNTLERARPRLIADMREYIARKASETARGISAR
jgi:hypothetical protein